MAPPSSGCAYRRKASKPKARNEDRVVVRTRLRAADLICVRRTVRSAGQLPELRPVGVHDVDRGVTYEDELVAVGRPARVRASAQVARAVAAQRVDGDDVGTLVLVLGRE